MCQLKAVFCRVCILASCNQEVFQVVFLFCKAGKLFFASMDSFAHDNCDHPGNSIGISGKMCFQNYAKRWMFGSGAKQLTEHLWINTISCPLALQWKVSAKQTLFQLLHFFFSWLNRTLISSKHAPRIRSRDSGSKSSVKATVEKVDNLILIKAILRTTYCASPYREKWRKANWIVKAK